MAKKRNSSRKITLKIQGTRFKKTFTYTNPNQLDNYVDDWLEQLEMKGYIRPNQNVKVKRDVFDKYKG